MTDNVFPLAAPVSRPLPLKRVMPPAQPYPLDALGSVLGGAAKAIMDKIQVPDAIAAQSVLGVAALAVQGHADMVIPATGQQKPVSLFLATVAASGERKSAADSEALAPVRKRELALRDNYTRQLPNFRNERDVWEKARETILKEMKKPETRDEAKRRLDQLGSGPVRPLTPMLTCEDPTLAGLHRLYMSGHPSLGLFSDEGGSFLGGNGMKEENRLLTATGLSNLWDGSPITRVRAEDGASVMPGRRLSKHLMMQPQVAARLLADPVLSDQGLLSRMLVAAPESLAGTRFQRPNDPRSAVAMQTYADRMIDILETQLPLREGTVNELTPRRLELSAAAKEAWAEFADEVERLIAPGAEWEPIKGFANKLPEHATRLAAVLELVEDLRAPEITLNAIERGIKLARFYAGEAMRLFDAGCVGEAIQRAEQLLSWLNRDRVRQIGLKTIYQRGPSALRTAKVARDAASVLVEHGWLAPLPLGTIIDGEFHKQAWEVVRH